MTTNMLPMELRSGCLARFYARPRSELAEGQEAWRCATLAKDTRFTELS